MTRISMEYDKNPFSVVFGQYTDEHENTTLRHDCHVQLILGVRDNMLT